jgi:hypothetical protein
MKKILLLSYPRSGSNFTTYILDFLLKHPFWFNSRGEIDFDPAKIVIATAAPDKDSLPASHSSPDEVMVLSKSTGELYAPGMPFKENAENSHVLKLHGQDETSRKEIQDALKEQPTLLMLLRDPFEAFHSHLKYVEGLEIVGLETMMPMIDYFFENLKTFHSYRGKKKVIFYEDLASDPSQYIKDLCHFMGAGTSVGEAFVSQYEAHFGISRHLYQNNQRDCQTNGKTTDHFSKECLNHRSHAYKDSFWETFFDLCVRTGTNGTEVYCRRYYEDFIGS